MATDESKRMDDRYRVVVPVTVHHGRDSFTALTDDVGFRGVFLRTDTPPDLRQLVRLTLALPPDHRPMTVHGMAVHVVPPGNPEGRTPGVGVQFYAVDRDTQSAWMRFIHHVQKHRPETHTRVPALGPPEPAGGEHRGFARFEAELELEVQSLGELHTLYTRDLAAGGMFIVTDLVLAPGAMLRVEVIHPRTRHSFVLDAVVRRQGESGGVRGLGVEFLAMDDGARVAFFDFVVCGDPRIVPRATAPALHAAP